MKMNSKVSIFTITLFMAAFLFPMLSSNVALGGIAPILTTGCCTTLEDGGQCVDCPDGETCLSSNFYCEEVGGFFDKGACSFDAADGGASCDNPVSRQGCCVIEPGSCLDNVDSGTCFFENEGGAEVWVSAQSCSQVRECAPTRNIPTLSNWALIVTAGVLVLVGIWGITRKKATA